MAEQPPSGWQVRGSMPLSSFELPQSGHSVQRKTKAGDGREKYWGLYTYVLNKGGYRYIDYVPLIIAPPMCLRIGGS